MTINKANFEAVVTQITDTWNSVGFLGDSVDIADPENTFGVAISSIYGNLSSIQAWASDKINQANQEEAELAVMTNFLAEMKVVFDKYAAKIEIGSATTGWGLSYGEGETATGFMLTATFDGLTATKEINKAVIVSGDLN